MIKDKIDLSTLEVPEGKDLTGFRLECPKHGNVSNQAFPIMFTNEDGHNLLQFICKGCLASYFASLVEKGELCSLKATPVFSEKPTNSVGETSENAKTSFNKEE